MKRIKMSRDVRIDGNLLSIDKTYPIDDNRASVFINAGLAVEVEDEIVVDEANVLKPAAALEPAATGTEGPKDPAPEGGAAPDVAVVVEPAAAAVADDIADAHQAIEEHDQAPAVVEQPAEPKAE